MKVILRIIPMALAFCQFALATEKNENINQGRSITLREQESKSPTKNMLDTLRTRNVAIFLCDHH